ncbi:MAG: hypothetical protein MI976_15530 [Pseudomonadales bacterium]|nr:hypothetical protein [Pseudomonadales bacterium]
MSFHLIDAIYRFKSKQHRAKSDKVFVLASMAFFFSHGLIGCTATEAPAQSKDTAVTIPLSVVWQSNNCNIQKPVIRELKNEQDWQSIYQQPALRMGQVNTYPQLDFATHSYSLVALGMKPNPGYNLSVNDSSATFTHGTLVLPVSETLPDSNRMYAQVMVSPCLILATPALGEITSIQLK